MRFRVCTSTTGHRPANKSSVAITRAATLAITAAAVISLSGCANQTAQYPSSSAQVAQAAIDVEDDGLPAQTPPSPSIREKAVDPSEPYSPNYGGANPSATAIHQADDTPATHEANPSPKIPNDLPPAFRRQLVTAMQDEDSANE